MALDFPTSPTNGQIYEQYKWNATDSVWVLNNPSSDKTPVSAVVSGSSVTPTYDGTAAVYSFTADGNIIIESAGYADILLVGGGGSGGVGLGGGGGGAGGHLYIENAYLPAGSLDVVIGAGGICAALNSNEGKVGQNGLASSLWKYYAPGGGAGGAASRSSDVTAQQAVYGLNGASGGGSGGWGHNGPPTASFGITGLGNAGGIATNANYFAGAGGGGAGTVGANTVTSGDGGAGGDGVANSITGSAVTRAGGGGGARGTGSTGGAGGSGGGGAGATSGSGTAGTANTGGGGGGGRDGIGATGGAGGSGIVIVRIN